MTLPDPTDVIAPRDDVPYEPFEYVGQMMEAAYPYGVVLEYHGLQLVSDYREGGPNVWSVHTPDCTLVEILNLEAFQTATEIEELLDELVESDPSDRSEWRDQADE